MEVNKFQDHNESRTGGKLDPDYRLLKHSVKDAVKISEHRQQAFQEHQREVAENHKVDKALSPASEIVESDDNYTVCNDDASSEDKVAIDPESDVFAVSWLRECAMPKVFTMHFGPTCLTGDVEAQPEDYARMEKGVEKIARKHAYTEVTALHTLFEQ